ncbi:UDP-N-acetylmuramate--L-alanine ligase (UDP-N-acetylmuramoyl-L-alanine synthetase) [Halobacteriovorax marinus SJ]|uniref:UDP-N-acetylmuramate--L-alanine ligase n=1 Tax=Halobacteriovorax marinus (strain ATCC BAA-682 / DSM 15412 / SJ) TaxID=862908 RepID=E1X250_HALMS|nr:UDP-N-acetylmuramate--L-alanine ligase [Halobacteriovorax marinus]CBW25006.1 UDP-N-acetylmuramate--L-alanine ligase (UDP-N-acetylmuramoyl-L-alanine synthetase) [Halobacteriovorax marinus SJ]
MFSPLKDIKVHFIGIGGIGMSGIAEVLLSLGYKVSGSDIAESATVAKLRKLGADVFVGHKSENITDATVMVYSSAIDDTNPEVIAAKAKRLPIMRRAEMLAELMRLKKGLAIAGTHGKTTTTSFLATILQESKYDPTYIIGGIVKNLDGHAKVGKGEFLVAEADESDGSFLLLNPIMSVVTNIDNDHMDHYGSEANLLSSFTEFINKVPFYGLTALNAHDERLMALTKEVKKPWVTFGVETEADFEARDIRYENNITIYDLYHSGEKKIEIRITIPGKHNILNSLGAIALAFNMGVPFEEIAKSIIKFDGVGRRFQTLVAKDNFEVIDDYAHHPTEIDVTLKAMKETRPNKKIVVVFEPHRYSRTRDCWDSFLHCFNSADTVYISPIYPASEKPIPGIEADRLIADINKLHPDLVKKLDSIENIDSIIDNYKEENVTLVTLGAGSIGRIIREKTNTK